MLAVTLAPFEHIDFWISVMVVAGTYAIFTLGLQLNVGYTGILNFGQAGFMAIGAYTMGLVVVRAHLAVLGRFAGRHARSDPRRLDRRNPVSAVAR